MAIQAKSGCVGSPNQRISGGGVRKFSSSALLSAPSSQYLPIDLLLTDALALEHVEHDGGVAVERGGDGRCDAYAQFGLDEARGEGVLIG